ncbi:MAG: membrane protein insertase YidC, partial [Kiritimatiellae bacterium]|nr:membrane protein insertase YidC [Kiritimatiellia bacterium]
MNKIELMSVVILFSILVGWGFLQKKDAPTPQPTANNASVVENGSGSVVTNSVGDVITTPSTTAVPASAVVGVNVATNALAVKHEADEKIVVLSNGVLRVEISSWGGAVKRADLTDYPETMDDDSAPVSLDFSANPALSIVGIPWLSTATDFEVEYVADNPRAVKITKDSGDGLLFERVIELGDEYQFNVTDSIKNSTDADKGVGVHGVVVAPMQAVATASKSKRFSYLGVDSLADAGGKRVSHWLKVRIMRKSIVMKQFNAEGVGKIAPPMEIVVPTGESTLWVAVKNKFFTQILVPSEPSLNCDLHAVRDVASSKVAIQKTWANLTFADQLVPSGESVTRSYDYYVGPKKYSILKARGQRQADVMEFGRWFAPVSKFLLVILNLIYSVFHNYGIAIILLTALVRIVFWPITHKGTESMQRMQKIQPLVTAVREKHKSNPQKMNQEVMMLYKQHKVNPMGGCLPMVIQIPVFIALFTVLRSAVELRYSSFLWIKDLSEPEGLFAGMLPYGLSLNILPLVMTATMVLQQRLTPSTGDAQQQKMMMFMPIVMLFIFYNMPSALVLYWSVSQGIAI